MDDSFVLLSSMSPKVTVKSYFKGTSILALKKNIRRSSICDKSVKTARNENLCIVEDSSTSTSPNTKSSNNSYRYLNKTPIVISDTEDSLSTSSKEDVMPKTPNRSLKNDRKCLLSKEKYKDINKWINSISDGKPEETTTFSEVSTIYGEEGDIFKPKEKGNAISSTFLESHNKNFNELFKKPTFKKTESKQQSFQNVIEDSFEDGEDYSHTSKEPKPCPKDVDLKKPDADIHYDESPKDHGDSCGHPDEQKTPICNAEEVEEISSLLDSIYGKKWREKEDQILPKTEPRNNHKELSRIHTERNAKTSLVHKNPYLDSEKSKSRKLLENLHRSKLRANIESPMIRKIKEICSSDTDSETSNVLKKPTATINFDDSSDDEIDSKKTSKNKNLNDCSNDEKENFEISDLDLTLEERIRKKILNIPSVQTSNKTKQSTVKKKLIGKSIQNKLPLQEVPSNTKTTLHRTGNIAKDCELNPDNDSISISSDDDEEWNRRISKITYRKPSTGTYSFLASLSGSVPLAKCDISARIYRNNFKNFKDQLVSKLFSLYNEKVFEQAIPADTLIEWNDRMRGTAGFCYCRKITRRNGTVERSVRIVLANKVLDSADRLRDTLIHEMCHAATWIVNCVSDGHGKYWKSWAYKAMETFPELPPIKRCHDYVISTKYTYRCTGCGYSIGRHSKSLDIERKRCGYCLGKFEVLINKVSKKGEMKSVLATPKKEANGFALFVKENYGTVKKSNLKHGDVMKILGQKFQEMKVNKI